jgi:hypothetical protein
VATPRAAPRLLSFLLDRTHRGSLAPAGLRIGRSWGTSATTYSGPRRHCDDLRHVARFVNTALNALDVAGTRRLHTARRYVGTYWAPTEPGAAGEVQRRL